MSEPVKPQGTREGGLITAYDSSGREVRITRAQWLESVLVPGLQAHWNDPGPLYDLILGALAEGFAAQLLEASARQLELDRQVMPERGYVVRGIVLMENQRLDDAEAVLQEGLQRIGETAPLLVNLAKVHSQRGDTAMADELLWAGVQRDPNLENGLAWWLAIQRERGGEEGYLHGLARACLLEGAWRPQLWLLQAYLDQQRWQDGEELLQALAKLDVPALQQQLDKFADAFARRKAQAQTPRAPAGTALQLETVTLVQPVWAYGLESPDWLFAPKDPEVPVVAFLSWSNPGAGQSAMPQEQREDDVGRLTRAVALYLAEATHYWTGYAGHTWVSVVKGGGPVVFAAEADGPAVAAVMPAQVRYFVTGAIDAGGQEVTLRMRLWQREGGSCVATESVSVKPDAVGSAVLVLEKRLLAHLGGAAAQPLDAFYARPASEAMGHYLVELGQAFLLTAIANGHGTRDRLWGERSMLEWPLHMALYWPQAEVAKIMYLSGLGKASHYGSKLLPEFRQRTLVLMKEAGRHRSVMAGLQPLVWKLFGMQEELAAFLREQGTHAAPPYRAWLRRVADSGPGG